MNEFYFAYGSNLNPIQMKDRVGEWISSKRVHAEGYKQVYNVYSPKRWKGWAANLKKTGSIDDKSYGVVYEITKQQLDTMTGWEGIEPTSISVKTENGKELEDVQVYIWPKERPSHEPPQAYKEAIITGLNYHGYKPEVIEQVRKEFHP